MILASLVSGHFFHTKTRASSLLLDSYKISKNAENYDRELLQIDSDILDVRHQLTVNKGLIKIQIEKEKEKLKQQKNKKRGEI